MGFAMSCKTDKNKFSNTPFLTLNWFTKYNNGFGLDSFILVNMHYTDGDGDIGLEPADTLGDFANGKPFFYNLKVWMLEKKNGKWQKLQNPFSPGDSLNFHERIPSITPKGRYKWIEGDLELKIPAKPLGLKPDTVKVQAQIIDRAKQQSQWIETEEFILKH